MDIDDAGPRLSPGRHQRLHQNYEKCIDEPSALHGLLGSPGGVVSGGYKKLELAARRDIESRAYLGLFAGAVIDYGQAVIDYGQAVIDYGQ